MSSQSISLTLYANQSPFGAFSGMWSGIKSLFSSTPPLRTDLKVEKISRWNYSTVAKLASLWEKTAKEKDKASRSSWFDFRAAQFRDSARLCRIISKELSFFSKNEVYVSKDESEKEQGIMLITKYPDYVYVDYLVTHPRNIRSRINKDEKEKVAGSGSSLLKAAEKRAKELKKKKIWLMPLEKAIPFYRKQGYKSVGSSMVKTLEKVSQIMPLAIVAA